MKRMIFVLSLAVVGMTVSVDALARYMSVPVQATGAGSTLSSAQQNAYTQINLTCLSSYYGSLGFVSYHTLVATPGSYTVRANATCTYWVTDPPYVYGVAKNLAKGEVHALDWKAGYAAFDHEKATVLSNPGTPGQYQFEFADYNGDNIEDLYIFKRSATGSGKTEVHVLAGPTYATYLKHSASALAATGTADDWKFLVGDYDDDGAPDVYAIKKNGGSGKTEVHILDGADAFKSYITHKATVLGKTGSNRKYDFALGDFDGDGMLDLYAINKSGTSTGKTELHVIDGATGFKTYLLQSATALGQTGTTDSWEFGAADYNHDGRDDLFGFNKTGTKMRLNILDAATGFGTLIVADKETSLDLSNNGGYWQVIAGDTNE